jgi:tRNA A-37 threonylcarbamoyl transferase component Bud32
MAVDAGSVVEGFRIERVLARGSAVVLCEATQLGLGRRVALRLVDGDAARDPVAVARFQRSAELLASLQHPNIVAIYAAGRSEHGLFVASQLVRGTTVAELVRERGLDSGRALHLLAQVADGLDSVHAAGLLHGDLAGESIIVDETDRAFLTGFALGDEAGAPATAASDNSAFAALLLRCLPGESDEVRAAVGADLGEHTTAAALVEAASAAWAAASSRRARRRTGLVVAVVVVVAIAALAAGAFGRAARNRAPPLASGAVALGSDLAAGPLRTVGCDALPPTSNSPDCTLLQTRLSGRALAADRAGVIRAWAVRGARGGLRLQVIRELADGRFVRVFVSQAADVHDRGAHRFATDIPVSPGDRVGVVLLPGAAIGVRAGGPAGTGRWFGPLLTAGRAPSRPEGTGFDYEVLLRADIVAGVQRGLPAQLTGGAAAMAPGGRELASLNVEVPGDVVERAALVRLRDRIVLDTWIGAERVARIEVPDADVNGELVEFDPGEFADAQHEAVPVADVHLAWMNPRARLAVEHRYALEARRINFID